MVTTHKVRGSSPLWGTRKESKIQTFLPYADFNLTASVLDYKRLGKQRLESQDAIVILTNEKPGTMSEAQYYYVLKRWKYHVIPKLWYGFIEALKLYFNIISEEWVRRGYKHNLGFYEVGKVKMPKWMGLEEFHSSHRASLLAKNYDYYRRFGWDEEPKIEYLKLDYIMSLVAK